nr:hypothetical protein [uncultured Draconibacterium sp.]
MHKETKWKDFLLKSGLPLEFEIREFLSSKKCICDYDYTYLRENEANQLTEFSYDIDASYIEDSSTIDFMIECKYRHESTKWLFLPEKYNSHHEIFYTSFMHPNDHFVAGERTGLYKYPHKFAPLCSKGIELTTQGQNPKSITQATLQLSYAMAEKYTSGFSYQIDERKNRPSQGTNFYSIPIIITTAQLFRLKENSSIESIKSSQEIEDIATKEEFIIMRSNESVHLEKYNVNIFDEFIQKRDLDNLKHYINSFNSDPEFVMSVIARHYCPSCFVIIHHTEDNIGLNKLFEYVDNVIDPDLATLELIIQKEQQLKEFTKLLNIKKTKS